MTEADNIRRPAIGKFAGDLGINVLSNLLAAAIIYVFGVIIGAFPRTLYFYIGVVLLFLFSLSGFILLFVSTFASGRRKQFTFSLAATLLGIVGIYEVATSSRLHEKGSTVDFLATLAYVGTPFIFGALSLLSMRWPKLTIFAPESWERRSKRKPAPIGDAETDGRDEG